MKSYYMPVSEENTRVTLTVPKKILAHVDKYVSEQYITRTKWLVDAMMDKMDKDNKIKIDRIVRGKK